MSELLLTPDDTVEARKDALRAFISNYKQIYGKTPVKAHKELTELVHADLALVSGVA